MIYTHKNVNYQNKNMRITLDKYELKSYNELKS
nr:MAG TPA: hypothetical protein [Caudoviricetes sp.]